MEHGAHPVTQIVGFDPPLDDHCVGALSKSFTRYYYPLTPVLPHSSFSWWVRARKRGGRGGGEGGRGEEEIIEAGLERIPRHVPRNEISQSTPPHHHSFNRLIESYNSHINR